VVVTDTSVEQLPVAIPPDPLYHGVLDPCWPRYGAATGHDAVALPDGRLSEAWPDADVPRDVVWPIHARVGRL